MTGNSRSSFLIELQAPPLRFGEGAGGRGRFAEGPGRGRFAEGPGRGRFAEGPGRGRFAEGAGGRLAALILPAIFQGEHRCLARRSRRHPPATPPTWGGNTSPSWTASAPSPSCSSSASTCTTAAPT